LWLDEAVFSLYHPGMGKKPMTVAEMASMGAALVLPSTAPNNFESSQRMPADRRSWTGRGSQR